MQRENLYKLNKDLLIKIIEEVNDPDKWDIEYLVNMEENIRKVIKKKKDEVYKYKLEKRKLEKVEIVKKFLSSFSCIDKKFEKIVEGNRDQIQNLCYIDKEQETKLNPHKPFTEKTFLDTWNFTRQFNERILNHPTTFKEENKTVISIIKNYFEAPDYLDKDNEYFGEHYYFSSYYFEEYMLFGEFYDDCCNICEKENGYAFVNDSCGDGRTILTHPKFAYCVRCNVSHCKEHICV